MSWKIINDNLEIEKLQTFLTEYKNNNTIPDIMFTIYPKEESNEIKLYHLSSLMNCDIKLNYNDIKKIIVYIYTTENN